LAVGNLLTTLAILHDEWHVEIFSKLAMYLHSGSQMASAASSANLVRWALAQHRENPKLLVRVCRELSVFAHTNAAQKESVELALQALAQLALALRNDQKLNQSFLTQTARNAYDPWQRRVETSQLEKLFAHVLQSELRQGRAARLVATYGMLTLQSSSDMVTATFIDQARTMTAEPSSDAAQYEAIIWGTVRKLVNINSIRLESDLRAAMLEVRQLPMESKCNLLKLFGPLRHSTNLFAALDKESVWGLAWILVSLDKADFANNPAAKYDFDALQMLLDDTRLQETIAPKGKPITVMDWLRDIRVTL
jgi:hypothetical protein